jgi:phosphate-selective porin O/P
MEYGSPVETFGLSLKVGLQIADHTRSRRATWAFGYFTDGQTPDVGDASASIARLTGRVTWLAVQPESTGDLLIHLGASASYVLSSRDRIRYQSRPESFLAPDLVDTGDLDTNNAFPFGLEFAAKRGPLTIQAEYLASVVDAGPLGHASLDGAYVSAGWFLTGEERAYDTSVGQMGALVPTHNVDPLQDHWTRGSWRHGYPGSISATARSAVAAWSSSPAASTGIGTATSVFFSTRPLRTSMKVLTTATSASFRLATSLPSENALLNGARGRGIEDVDGNGMVKGRSLERKAYWLPPIDRPHAQEGDHA